MRNATAQSKRIPVRVAIEVPPDRAVFVAAPSHPTWAQITAPYKGCGFVSMCTELMVNGAGPGPSGDAELTLSIRMQVDEEQAAQLREGLDEGEPAGGFSFMTLSDVERRRLIYTLMTPAEREAIGAKFGA